MVWRVGVGVRYLWSPGVCCTDEGKGARNVGCAPRATLCASIAQGAHRASATLLHACACLVCVCVCVRACTTLCVPWCMPYPLSPPTRWPLCIPRALPAPVLRQRAPPGAPYSAAICNMYIISYHNRIHRGCGMCTVLYLIMYRCTFRVSFFSQYMYVYSISCSCLLLSVTRNIIPTFHLVLHFLFASYNYHYKESALMNSKK